MTKAEEKTAAFIREKGMISAGDHVIIGLSGGADSVFLFHLMICLRPVYDLSLSAVHVHHGIRGEEADRDAAFVSDLCRAEDVPCRIVRRDIPAEACETGHTLEEAGRIARYQIYLEEALHEEAPLTRVKIALAHQMNDVAENVLFQMARGCGMAGIGSLRPLRPFSARYSELRIIRPLLGLSKEEIEASLKESGKEWCEDSTNGERDAARNRIRLDILPKILDEVNSGAVRHLAAAAEMAGEASDFIRSESLRRSERYLQWVPQGIRILSTLSSEMTAVRVEILRMALVCVTPGQEVRDIGQVHLKALDALLSKRTGARLDLPRGVQAIRVPEGVLLTAKTVAHFSQGREGHMDPSRFDTDLSERSAASSWRLTEVALPVWEKAGEGTPLAVGNLLISAVLEEAPPVPLPEIKYTKWIDYAKINGHLTVRTRRPGDFLTVGAGMRKSLSDYFTNEKVPPSERDRILLVADGCEIVWVLGMRIGYRYRIRPATGRTLRLTAAEDRNE